MESTPITHELQWPIIDPADIRTAEDRELALCLLTGETARLLELATVIQRGDGAKLSSDERFHARHYAELAIGSMDQRKLRDARERSHAAVLSIYKDVAEQVREHDEDHSYHYLVGQACARFVQELLNRNLPFVVRAAEHFGLRGER